MFFISSKNDRHTIGETRKDWTNSLIRGTIYYRMRRWVVSGIIVSAIIAAAVGGYLLKSANTPATTLKANQTAVNKPEVASKPPTRAELLKLVNEQRAKVGVAPLKEDSRLDWSAQQKADDEVKYNYFGHFRNGVFIGQQFIDQTGISCRLDSENLTSANTASLAVTYWTNSKAHYDAMVSPNYTLTGLGIAYTTHIPKSNEGSEVEDPIGITDSYVLVQHFCQP